MQTLIELNPDKTSDFIIISFVTPFILHEYFRATKSSHPHLLGLPVVAPNSLPILLILSPSLSNSSAVFDRKNNRIRDTRAEILSQESFKIYLEKDNVYFIGNTNRKIKEIIRHKNANFIDDIFPSAKQMGILSYNKFKLNQFEDLNDFEPFYLKDFIGAKWNPNS